MARRRLITIDPTEQEEGFDRFVHVDEVAAVAAERDAYRDALEAIRDYMGIPADIDHLGLVSIVERNRRDFALVAQGVLVHAHAVHVLSVDGARTSALLRAVAVALGQPDQDLADLPASVEALRLQRDRLQAAAQDALAIGRVP